MRIVKLEPTGGGAGTVSVYCKGYGRTSPEWDKAGAQGWVADLDGEPYQSYYCPACNPANFDIVSGVQHKKIKQNDVVRIKPEWQDPGDDEFVWIAVEDEDGGRVLIEAKAGLPINPRQVVTTDMLE